VCYVVSAQYPLKRSIFGTYKKTCSLYPFSEKNNDSNQECIVLCTHFFGQVGKMSKSRYESYLMALQDKL